MIRQAHTYLVSAMSGATLIAIAIVAFVLLVSAQVFESWPIAAFGGGDKNAKVSDAHAVGSGSATAATAAGLATAPAGQGAAGGGGDNAAGGGQRGGGTAPPGTPSGGGSEAGGGGGDAGGGSGGSEGGSGGGGSNQAPSQGSSSSAGGGSSSGGGSSAGGSSASSTSGKLTETVNETVNGVDETVLGGTLEKTGVTAATEEVVNGVAGSESLVGHVVDETVNTVGGLLGGKR